MPTTAPPSAPGCTTLYAVTSSGRSEVGVRRNACAVVLVTTKAAWAPSWAWAPSRVLSEGRSSKCERASSSFGSPLLASAASSSFIEKPIDEAIEEAPFVTGSSTTVEARDVRGEVDRELTDTAPPPSRPTLDVSLFEGRSRIVPMERTGAVSGANAASLRLASAEGAAPGAAAMRFGCRSRLGADACRFGRRKGAVSGGSDEDVEASCRAPISPDLP